MISLRCLRLRRLAVASFVLAAMSVPLPQFRAEYFNLSNRVNLLNPGLSASDTSGTGTVQHTANLSNAGFGQITADLAPRIGQLAFKLVF